MAIAIPYTMLAMLLPISNEVMKRDWSLKNSRMIFAEKRFFFKSTSN